MQKSYIEEINKILKEIFNLNENTPIFDVNVYFVDTEYDEVIKDYEKKFQDTIDIMMERMKLDVEIYNSINTENLDITGNNIKMKNDNYKKKSGRIRKNIKKRKIKKRKRRKREKKIRKRIRKRKKKK